MYKPGLACPVRAHCNDIVMVLVWCGVVTTVRAHYNDNGIVMVLCCVVLCGVVTTADYDAIVDSSKLLDMLTKLEALTDQFTHYRCADVVYRRTMIGPPMPCTTETRTWSGARTLSVAAWPGHLLSLEVFPRAASCLS